MRKFISGPAIAALHHRTRKWANDHLNRGTFGKILTCRHVVYAELTAVELAAGETFSVEQLAKAADGKPNRIIILPDQEQEAA